MSDQYGQQPVQPEQNPQYQQPYYAPQPQAQTNVLAIITIIAAFVVPIAGIITGHISLKQIKQTGEQGEGMAKAGLIISYVFTGIGVLIVLAYIAFIVFALIFAGAAGTISSY